MMHADDDGPAFREDTWIALANQLNRANKVPSSRGSIEWPEDEAETSSDATVVRKCGREVKRAERDSRRDAHQSEESYAGSESSRASRQRLHATTSEIEVDASQELRGTHLHHTGSGLAGAAAQRQKRRMERRLLREAAEEGENPGHAEVVQNVGEAHGSAEPELEDIYKRELTRYKTQPRTQIPLEEDSDPDCHALRKQKTESSLRLKNMKAGKEVEDEPAPPPPHKAPSAAELANRIKLGQFRGGKIVDFTGRQRGSSGVLKPRYDLKFDERGGRALDNGAASRPASGILKSRYMFAEAPEQEWGEVGIQPKTRSGILRPTDFTFAEPKERRHRPSKVVDKVEEGLKGEEKLGPAVAKLRVHIPAMDEEGDEKSAVTRPESDSNEGQLGGGQLAAVRTRVRGGSDPEGGGRKEPGSTGRVSRKGGGSGGGAIENSRTSSKNSRTPSDVVSPGGFRSRARLKDLRLNPNELTRLQHQVAVSGGDSKASNTPKTPKSGRAGGAGGAEGSHEGGPAVGESPRLRKTLSGPPQLSRQGTAEDRIPTILEAPRRVGGGEKQVPRESAVLVKHDKVFCDWKVLVAARDWEKHRKSPDRLPRYQTQNLPNRPVGPGVYELGLMLSGGSHRPINNEDVIVVYVGTADNIRARLQKLGHGGSHLGSLASSKPKHATRADVVLEGGGKVVGVPPKPVCRSNSSPVFLANGFSGGEEGKDSHGWGGAGAEAGAGAGAGGSGEAPVSPALPRLSPLPSPCGAFSPLPSPMELPSPSPSESRTSKSGSKTPLSGVPRRDQWMTAVEWEERESRSEAKSTKSSGGREGGGDSSSVGKSHGGGGSNLFQAAFDRGYSVVFRWAKAVFKERARAAETSLLAFFDYAWNTNTGDRRAIEVLEFWDGGRESGKVGCFCFAPPLKGIQLDLQKPKAEEPLTRKQERVENVGKSREDNGGTGGSTSGKSEIQGGESGSEGGERGWPGLSSAKHLEIGVVKSRHKLGELAAAGEDKVVMVRDPTMGGKLCAASLGHGNVCPNKPLKGKKRCALHRGMKVYAQVLRET